MVFSSKGVCPDPKKISAFVTHPPLQLFDRYGHLQLTVYPKLCNNNRTTSLADTQRCKIVWQPEQKEAYHKLTNCNDKQHNNELKIKENACSCR